MPWLAGLAALATVGTTIAAGLNTPDAPEAPNYAAASQAGIEADLNTLPARRAIDAAAQLGGQALKYGYTRQAVNGNQAVADAQQTVAGLRAKLAATQPTTILNQNQLDPVTGRRGTAVDNPEYKQLQAQLDTAMRNLSIAEQNSPKTEGETAYQYFDKNGNAVLSSEALADFTGLGTTDVAAANADKAAAANLELQKKYGADYIDINKQLLQQADPEGYAARLKEYDLIQNQIGNKPNTALSDELMAQIQAELGQGATLDPEVAREVEQNTRRGQAARGNVFGTAPAFQEAMNVGTAAENRRTQRQQKALGFLTSGATADDINLRSNQQNISNLSAFLSGQTPVAQFQQLSGAGAGAVPFSSGNAANLPTTNPNAGQQGASYALGQTSANQNAYSQNAARPNPWLSGLSTLTTSMPTLQSTWPSAFGK